MGLQAHLQFTNAVTQAGGILEAQGLGLTAHLRFQMLHDLFEWTILQSQVGEWVGADFLFFIGSILFFIVVNYFLTTALFLPPSHRRFWVRTGRVWEGWGRKLPTTLAGGVILVEATKQVHAPTKGGLPAALKGPLEALGGLAKPAPKPVSQKVSDDS